jgi:glycosyltransferase involved in cell wall biosynthesis
VPLVSTVLLSYNQKEFLRDAVESVLRQTFDDHELVIVDNGSKDGSQALLGEYRDRPNVRLTLHERNEPITQRLNQGIASAHGEFISLLFSDDYYLPNKLEQQVPVLRALDDSYGIVYSPGWQENVLTNQRWLEDRVQESGRVFETLLDHCPAAFINPIAPLYRRRCFEQYPFYEDLFQEGEAILFRIALRWKFQFQREPTVVMRDHARNIGKAVKRNTEIFQTLMDRLVNDPDFPPADHARVRALRVRCLRLAGWQLLRVNGDPDWSRRMLIETARVEWRNVLHPKTVLGVGLSVLPATLRRRANRVLNAILRPQGNTTYVEDYR